MQYGFTRTEESCQLQACPWSTKMEPVWFDQRNCFGKHGPYYLSVLMTGNVLKLYDDHKYKKSSLAQKLKSVESGVKSVEPGMKTQISRAWNDSS